MYMHMDLSVLILCNKKYGFSVCLFLGVESVQFSLCIHLFWFSGVQRSMKAAVLVTLSPIQVRGEESTCHWRTSLLHYRTEDGI